MDPDLENVIRQAPADAEAAGKDYQGQTEEAVGDQDDGHRHAGQCRIKGNINRKGERIYHMPGGEWYDQTRIDSTKGELWFCTEAEARAAGWRRARQ